MTRSRTLMPTLAVAIGLVATVATPGVVLASPQVPDVEYGDGYQAGDYGRVRYHDNGLTVRRAAAEQPLPDDPDALLNAPIYPGDTVLTGPRQRAEIVLADGAAVRIDEGSEITFLALPSPYAEFRDNTVLQLAAGTLRIDAEPLGQEEFRIDTPSASIYLLGAADVHVEIAAQGVTRVASRRGVVEVVGDGGSVLVRGGMQASVWAGDVPADPAPFNTFVTDEFDRWVERRDAAYRTNDRYAGAMYDQLPEEVRPYYGELSRHGNWVNTDDYGYVWVPVGVADGWRPYYDGYWDYGPHGYFWVSREPWGWAPYHYGRWNWVGGIGWCWAPARTFAGAWVAWSWGSVYVGWSPLDYWGRPCWTGSTYYHGYYSPYSWTFVNVTYINYPHTPRYAVPVGSIHNDLRSQWVTTRPPSVGPRQVAGSESARARALREVRDDEAARLRPREPGATRGARALPDVDRDMRSDRAALRGRSGGDRPGGAGESRLAARYPRRISSPGDNGGVTTTTGGRARPGMPATDGRGRSATSRSAAPSGTDDRVRDLYDRMAEPRRTRGRPGDDSGGDSGVRPTPTRERAPSRQARPGGTSRSSEGSSASPSSPRSGSSRPGATRGRPTQPRESASPRRSSPPSRESRPSASPRRSSPPSRESGSSASPRRSAPSRSSGSSASPRRSAPSRSSGSSASPRRSSPPPRESGSSASPRRSAPSRSSGSSASPRRSSPPPRESGSSASPRRSAPSRSSGSSASPRRSSPPPRSSGSSGSSRGSRGRRNDAS